MTKEAANLLTEYKWRDVEPVLYPVVNGLKKFNPPVGMEWVVRTLSDMAIFFKTESDMIAFEVEDCIKYEHIKRRRDLLQSRIVRLND
tara:strand:+ start:598 stop:861 length:264 start_codon:yes stop_codon:yes gene_type:complete